MKRIRLILVMLGLTAIAALIIFLVTWEIPAPSARVEKVVPSERLPR